MAQKTQVILIDDVDGSSADETVSFSLDGVSYEIDLTSAHAAELRNSLAHWVGNARKVSRLGAPVRAGRRGAATDKAQLAAIRSWAKDNGYAVSERGRIAKTVLDAFQAAH